MRYGLYPWTWDSEQQEHRPPDGAVCCLDLRPLPEQAKQEQSGGWGFFAWNGGGDPPSDVISLGDGDCRSLQPTTSQRDELRLRLGLSANPQGATLVDVIGDVLGSLADPTGQTGPKPLMPIQGDGLEILLAGHSKVWGSPYDAVEVMSISPKGRANKQRQVWREIMQQALDVSQEHAEKVLGAILRQHGVSMVEIDQGAPSKKSQWQRFLHARDIQRAGGAFRPRRPKTSFSESFNKADSSTLGPDLTWTEVTGNLDVVSNKASTTTTGFAEVRAEHDVSSADHYGQVVIHQASSSAGDNHLAAPCARFASSARTFYSFAWFYNLLVLYKTVAGSYTIIGSASETPAALPATWKVDCSGSTIRGLQNGTQKVSVTDTAITGNTRGGLWAYRPSGVQITMDDFLVDDGISAGGQPMALRRGTRHGFARIGRQV